MCAEKNGVIEYKRHDGTIVFSTHPREKERLILQLGSACPRTALEAARLVQQDVRGVDLNCGCPKDFSIKGGMGAALLATPDLLIAILQALLALLAPQGIEVSCKIRIAEPLEDTLHLVDRLRTEAVGLSRVAVHARARDNRPRHPARWHVFVAIQRRLAGIPLIVNGDFFSSYDIARFRQEYPSIRGFLIARGAMRNPEIFKDCHSSDTAMASSLSNPNPDAVVPAELFRVAWRYLSYARQVENPFRNTKYVLMQMWASNACDLNKCKIGAKLLHARAYDDLVQAFVQ